MKVNNTPTKLFITGVTGYIGGSVLTKLLESSQKGKYDITVLVRSEEAASKYKKLGVTPLIGDLDSAYLLKQAAINTDVVMHFANSADHLPSAKALIEGLQAQDGKRRIYIHTSGTGNLIDDARGNYASNKIYDDLDLEPIRALPSTQLHKEVDDYVLANNQGYESIIVVPPTIYGLGTGLYNRQAIQIPGVIKAFLKAGKGGLIGKGLNIWDCIHIDDLANFYVFLLEKAIQGKASTGKDGWYFIENGEYVWKDVYVKITEELYKLGAVSSPKVGEFTSQEIESLFGIFAWLGLATNARSRANRAKQLGWKPNPKNPGLLETIEEEVRFLVPKKKTTKKTHSCCIIM